MGPRLSSPYIFDTLDTLHRRQHDGHICLLFCLFFSCLQKEANEVVMTLGQAFEVRMDQVLLGIRDN